VGLERADDRYAPATNPKDLAHVLAELLGMRAVPNLESLHVSHFGIGDEGALAIVRGLVRGRCYSLKTLSIIAIGMGRGSATALAEAIVSLPLSRLESITLANNRSIGDDAICRVLQALMTCPHLFHVRITSTGQGRRFGDAFLGALDRNIWPNLLHLAVHDTGFPDERMVQQMVKAFDRGTCPKLQTLTRPKGCMGFGGVFALRRRKVTFYDGC